MSDTPRTDAKRVLCGYGEEMVNVDFARELERENAALRSRLVGATCIHHNDAERAAAGCPVCLRAELAALTERAERYRLASLKPSGGKRNSHTDHPEG